MGDIIRGSTPFVVISDDAVLIKPDNGERERDGGEKPKSDKTIRCKELCDVLTLKPLRDAIQGSNIAWVTLTLTLICTFGVVLYLSEYGKNDSLVASLLLIALMIIGVVGQLICLYKKDNVDFVQFIPLAAGHCNMYLMAGVYLFGTGTLLTIILRLLIYYHAHESIDFCSSTTNVTLLMKPVLGVTAANTTKGHQQAGIFCYSEIALDGARLVFTGVQLVFMQTFRAATFRSSSGVKFVLYHTIVTNACIWINYVLDETDLLNQKKPHVKIGDAYVEKALSFCEVMTPFVLEYSLIVAGILHSISSQMQNPKDRKAAPAPCTQAINRGTGEGSAGADESFVVIQGPYTTPLEAAPLSGTIKSTRSQPGFILGIFCGLVLVCSSLTFGTESTKFNKRSRDFFLLYEGILALVQTIIVFVILKLLQRHTQREHETRSEDALLIVGFIGIFIFQFIAMYSSISCLTTTDQLKCSEDRGTSSITIVQLLFIGVSNILQTIVFILSRRYTPNFPKERRSSGKIRQCILFLLTTNLSYWALDSFIELKNKATSSYPGGKELFGDGRWNTIVAFTFPVAIFFRFHCAAMLYEFWRRFSPQNNPEEKLHAPTEDPANQQA